MDIVSKTFAGHLRNTRVHLNLLLQKFDELDAEGTSLRLERLFAHITTTAVPGVTALDQLKTAIRMRLLSRDDVRATLTGLVEINSWANRLREICSASITDMELVLSEMDGGNEEERQAVSADSQALGARARARLVGIMRKATIPDDDIVAKGHGGPVASASAPS